MVPRTYPSSVDTVSGHTQMVAYMLPSVSGLTKWIDYIPVRKGNEQVVGGSYGSYIFVDAKMSQPSGQAWIDYIPVYEDGSATDAWMINAQGYIPYGSASIAAAIQAVRRNNGTMLYVPDDYGLVLGPELVTNGDFDTDTAWTKGVGWTISGGRLIATGVSLGVGCDQPNLPLVSGTTYRITVEVDSYTSGNVRWVWAGGAAVGANMSAVGVYTTTFVANGINTISLVANSGATTSLSVASISVREIISATTYIDSTGTQPVTAIGDLVGLLTDRSYGSGNLGAELVTNGDFSAGTTGWSGISATLSAASNALTLTSTVASGGGAIQAWSDIATVIGKTYRISGSVQAFANITSPAAKLRATTTGFTLIAETAAATSPSPLSVTFVATATTTRIVMRVDASGLLVTSTATFGAVSVREVLGNHGTQPTTASKPLVTQLANGTKALDFDGSNDRLLVTTPPITTAATVIVAGVVDAAGTRVLFGQDTGGIQFFFNADMLLTASINGGAQFSTAHPHKLEIGVPFVASMVFRGGGLTEIYLNGVQRASASTLAVANATNVMGVFAQGTSGSFPVDGRLIDFAFSNTAMADADRKTIERNMANRAGVTYAG